MISSPDSRRADIPARAIAPASIEYRMPRHHCRAGLRRAVYLALAIPVAATWSIGFAAASDSLDVTVDTLIGTAAAADERPVNLFVDVVSTRLAEEIDLADKRRVDLAGVPIVLGATRQDGGAAQGVTAGIAGRADWTLDDRWSLRASGAASRAHVIDTLAPGASRAGGDLALKFNRGGTGLQLRPSLLAALEADALHHWDLGLEATLRQEIDDGIALSAGAGHGRHESLALDTEDRATSFGRLGLAVDLAQWSLPRGSDLEITYAAAQHAGPNAAQFRFSQDVALQAHLAVAGGWRLGGRYALSATERGYDDANPGARRSDLRQRLTLESAWVLESAGALDGAAESGGAKWRLTADYAFERSVAEASAPTPALHAANINLVLNF